MNRSVKHLLLVSASVLALSAVGCSRPGQPGPVTPQHQWQLTQLSLAVKKVVANAHAQTTYTHEYDPAYVTLSYPGGDVPRRTGVCTDVVIRAMRGAGVDLQKEVHEDMRTHFSAYPRRYGLKRPDRSIDHRRVPNLMTYFSRKGRSLPMSTRAEDYRPGDIVAWKLSSGMHIGLVSDVPSSRGWGWQIIHNIGGGARVEDALFGMEVIGHYRYFR